jgi:hypothetical protein
MFQSAAKLIAEQRALFVVVLQAFNAVEISI